MNLFRALCIALIVCLCAAVSVAYIYHKHYRPVFITQDLAPDFCPIKNWGPRSSHVNTGFNVQPDGRSALWVITDCYPDSVAFSFAGSIYHATQNDGSITTAISNLTALRTEGDLEVSLFDKNTGRRQHVGLFTVKAAPTSDATDQQNQEAQHQTAEQKPEYVPRPLTPPRLVSHAAGGFNARRYRNSMEALDYNYALGHRMFEVDFSWTADQRLAGIHDWGSTYKRLFPQADHQQRPTYAELLDLLMDNNESIITLARLRQWLSAHPDAYIVTDIKSKNVTALETMKEELQDQYRQVVPQLYHPHNYQAIKTLGYEHIIFTLYATRLSTDEIIAFVTDNPLLAVTLHPKKKGFSELVPRFNTMGVFVYVHTYNTLAEYQQYRELGADGIYTDFLYLDDEQNVREP